MEIALLLCALLGASPVTAQVDGLPQAAALVHRAQATNPSGLTDRQRQALAAALAYIDQHRDELEIPGGQTPSVQDVQGDALVSIMFAQETFRGVPVAFTQLRVLVYPDGDVRPQGRWGHPARFPASLTPAITAAQARAALVGSRTPGFNHAQVTISDADVSKPGELVLAPVPNFSHPDHYILAWQFEVAVPFDHFVVVDAQTKESLSYDPAGG